MKRMITLHVNGEGHTILVEDKEALLEAPRDRLSLTGTKDGEP